MTQPDPNGAAAPPVPNSVNSAGPPPAPVQQQPQGPTSTSRVEPLACDSDEANLSPKQVFMREQLQFFETPVAFKARGGREDVMVHQVGLRCVHCAEGGKETAGASSFPFKFENLSRSAVAVFNKHIFPEGKNPCSGVRPEVVAKWRTVPKTETRSPKGAIKYWIEQGKAKNLVVTSKGIFFDEQGAGSRKRAKRDGGGGRAAAVTNGTAAQVAALQPLANNPVAAAAANGTAAQVAAPPAVANQAAAARVHEIIDLSNDEVEVKEEEKEDGHNVATVPGPLQQQPQPQQNAVVAAPVPPQVPTQAGAAVQPQLQQVPSQMAPPPPPSAQGLLAHATALAGSTSHAQPSMTMPQPVQAQPQIAVGTGSHGATGVAAAASAQLQQQQQQPPPPIPLMGIATGAQLQTLPAPNLPQPGQTIGTHIAQGQLAPQPQPAAQTAGAHGTGHTMGTGPYQAAAGLPFVPPAVAGGAAPSLAAQYQHQQPPQQGAGMRARTPYPCRVCLPCQAGNCGHCKNCLKRCALLINATPANFNDMEALATFYVCEDRTCENPRLG